MDDNITLAKGAILTLNAFIRWEGEDETDPGAQRTRLRTVALLAARMLENSGVSNVRNIDFATLEGWDPRAGVAGPRQVIEDPWAEFD